MLRVFITGSSDGIGLVAARRLIGAGHRVTLHARSSERAKQTAAAAPGCADVLVGDLRTVDGMRSLARDANKAVEDGEKKAFDVVIHNAGVGYSNTPASKIGELFNVNSLAPYVLTCLMKPPKRLIYISSGLHSSGDDSLADIGYRSKKQTDTFSAYSDSKLHNVILAFAVARKWGIESVSVDPGWVQTKLAGRGAPGTVEAGADTMSFLAESKEVATGKHYVNRKVANSKQVASSAEAQDKLLEAYKDLSGISFPEGSKL